MPSSITEDSTVVNREELSKDFLEKAGFGQAKRIKLPGDASFRRYERLSLDGKQYILMDAPPIIPQPAAILGSKCSNS